MSDIWIGSKIRFSPAGGSSNRWWTVQDVSERYIVATVQAPFQPKGKLWYTVVDLTGWANKTHNGYGNGIVRSSLNTLGGGWGDNWDEIIPLLEAGRRELSHRRIFGVDKIEIKDD